MTRSKAYTVVERLLGDEDLDDLDARVNRPDDKPFEQWVRDLISAYEEMGDDVWSEYDVDEVEQVIGREALNIFGEYDLDTTPDGADEVIADQILSAAKKFHFKR